VFGVLDGELADVCGTGNEFAGGFPAARLRTGRNGIAGSRTPTARQGWRPYQGAGVYNTTPTTPDGITGGHYDHVHISVY